MDDEKSLLAAAERVFRTHPKCQSQAWQLLTCSDPGEAQNLIEKEKPAVIISDQRMPKMTGIELLSWAKKASPDSTRLLLTGFQEEEVVEAAVNEASTFRFLNKPWNENELLHDIEKAVEHHETSVERKRLLSDVSLQNKKLEELTSGLERIIAERTESIESSKVEVERSLAEMRRLIHFIKELAGLTVIDEMLLLLRKELKSFHAVRNPMVCYQTTQNQLKILSFRGQDLVEKEVKQEWSSSLRLRINDIEDQKYLARQLSRPFAHLIAIPLKGRGFKDNANDLPVVFFIEHSLKDDEIDDFLDFMSQRLQPVGIAVDRILLEYHAKFGSYQWEKTFDGIQHPVAIIDSEYQLLRVNRLFAHRPQRAKCYNMLASSEIACVGCPVGRALETGESQTGQVHVKGKIFEVTSYPIYVDGDRRRTHVINHYVDITRPRELYSQMVQNEKMAAIGLLAGNIAHELNNPLTGIRSLSQVLIEELKNQKNEEVSENLVGDLEEIEKASGRCQEIIKNLLEFSTSEEGGEDYSVTPLNEIVEKTLPLLKTAMRQHSGGLELSENTINVEVNSPLLQQVVFNIVNNACQAMTEPGTIHIKTQVLDDKNKKGQNFAELSIADTGPGIPEDVLEYIFQPFFTTKGEGKGTGLGLSMSRSIVEKFGGDIHVESKVGEGTCFKIHLPVKSMESVGR